jgi:hypothetical protein
MKLVFRCGGLWLCAEMNECIDNRLGRSLSSNQRGRSFSPAVRDPDVKVSAKHSSNIVAYRKSARLRQDFCTLLPRRII